jgi:hypothetical protein
MSGIDLVYASRHVLYSSHLCDNDIPTAEAIHAYGVDAIGEVPLEREIADAAMYLGNVPTIVAGAVLGFAITPPDPYASPPLTTTQIRPFRSVVVSFAVPSNTNPPAGTIP